MRWLREARSHLIFCEYSSRKLINRKFEPETGIIPCMPSIVAIDIETTGLDPQSDAIIEIGAVRFNGHRIEAEWTTLVNPGRPIPPFITQLTGITNEMVRNAPPIKAVIQDLADFVGDAPVIGHNVRFDLCFPAAPEHPAPQ